MSNVPLLIELHETVYTEEDKVWDGAFMVDVCHITSIEKVAYVPMLSVAENRKRIDKLKSHKVERSFSEYYIPACSVIRYNDKTYKVIETYEEIREKIAKAGVVVP